METLYMQLLNSMLIDLRDRAVAEMDGRCPLIRRFATLSPARGEERNASTLSPCGRGQHATRAGCRRVSGKAPRPRLRPSSLSARQALRAASVNLPASRFRKACPPACAGVQSRGSRRAGPGGPASRPPPARLRAVLRSSF
jgi:hypothetical protein